MDPRLTGKQFSVEVEVLMLLIHKTNISINMANMRSFINTPVREPKEPILVWESSQENRLTEKSPNPHCSSADTPTHIALLALALWWE